MSALAPKADISRFTLDRARFCVFPVRNRSLR
jgi:hypothetical protein